MNTERHQRGLRKQKQGQGDQHGGPDDEDDQGVGIQLLDMACEGFKVPGSGGRLASVKDSLMMYLSFSSPSNRSHEYIQNLTSHTATLRHRNCAGRVLGMAPLCKECLALGKDRTILRNIGRFRCKMFAAQLLKAKLFQTEQVVQALLEEMKCMDMYVLEKEEPQLRDEIDLG